MLWGRADARVMVLARAIFGLGPRARVFGLELGIWSVVGPGGKARARARAMAMARVRGKG